MVGSVQSFSDLKFKFFKPVLLMSPKNQTYQSQSCLVLNCCKSLDQKMHLQITPRLFKFFSHSQAFQVSYILSLFHHYFRLYIFLYLCKEVLHCIELLHFQFSQFCSNWQYNLSDLIWSVWSIWSNHHDNVQLSRLRK